MEFAKTTTSHRFRWNSLELLDSLCRHDILLSDDVLNQYLDLIDYAMVTEFDACNFDNYLTRRTSEDLVLTPDFMAFRTAWQADEWNHYVGYRRIIHLLTGESEIDLHRRASERPCNFTKIAHFLEDEFRICITFAYDEIVTRHACRLAVDIFRSFGNERFIKWINLVGRDEARHFAAIVKVVRARHCHRLDECSSTLDELVAWDLDLHPYHATFILDHDVSLFGEEALRQCARTVLRAVSSSGRQRTSVSI